MNTKKASQLATVKLICKALDDKKVEGLRVLDVSEQSSITDFLVVATGTSEPHLRALRVELEKVLDAERVKIIGMDDDFSSGWLVVDAFDVMIHIFTNEKREHYGLENLWKDALEIPMSKLFADSTKVAKTSSKAKIVRKKLAVKKKPTPKAKSKKAKAPK